MRDEAVDGDRVPEHGVLSAPDQAWAMAVRQAEVIGPLATAGALGGEAADAAGERLGISRRQVYVLLRR